MGKILILKVEARYNVLGIFTDYMAKEFENLGYQVIIVDLMKSFIELRKVFMHTYKFIFSFNGAGSDFNIEGWNIFSRLKVPYITILVDHPVYHNYRISQPIARFACSCIDKGHSYFIKEYISTIKNVSFLPHGGCVPEKIIPYIEREYDIILAGSYADPLEVYEELCKRTGDTGRELTKFWMEHIDLTLEEAFRRFLQMYGHNLEKDEFLRTINELKYVDRYVRAYYRDIIVKEIIKNNIKIDVFGEGWEKFYDNSGLVVRHGEVNFLDILEVIGNSKIVLNATTLYKDGGHERIFTSMLAGSVCLTDRTRYLEYEFEEDREIIFYDLNKLEKIPNKIINILKNSGKAEEITKRAQEKAKDKHQWKNRAEEIIRISESI